MVTEEAASYVYCVLPAGAAAPAVEGILPNTPVTALPAGELTALASRVPRALFDRTNPSHRTAEPDWMAARVAAHHAVNVAATASGPCLPMAFGVLFSQREGLLAWLAAKQAALTAALAQVAGQSEWGLSLQQDAAATAAWLEQHDPDLRALAAAAAGAGEGTAFLMARRRDKARGLAERALIRDHAEALIQGLTARGFRVLAEPNGAQGLPAWTVFTPTNAGPLAESVKPLAAEMAPAGLSLRVTGPWPNYAFARTALAAEANHA